MTINFTFNSIDEMEESIVRLAEALHNDKFLTLPDVPAIAAGEPVTHEEEDIPTAPSPEEPEPAKAEEPKPETPKKADRVSIRKLLSDLNKKTGENTARKLISDMGYRVLTDVPDDKLAELKARAEEVLNA